VRRWRVWATIENGAEAYFRSEGDSAKIGVISNQFMFLVDHKSRVRGMGDGVDDRGLSPIGRPLSPVGRPLSLVGRPLSGVYLYHPEKIGIINSAYRTRWSF
jgi:hypothetical protein